MSGFPPCVDCGEEPGSCPDGRCRDCDIHFIMQRSICTECHRFIYRLEALEEPDRSDPAFTHAAGCSKATKA